MSQCGHCPVSRHSICPETHASDKSKPSRCRAHAASTSSTLINLECWARHADMSRASHGSAAHGLPCSRHRHRHAAAGTLLPQSPANSTNLLCRANTQTYTQHRIGAASQSHPPLPLRPSAQLPSCLCFSDVARLSWPHYRADLSSQHVFPSLVISQPRVSPSTTPALTPSLHLVRLALSLCLNCPHSRNRFFAPRCPVLVLVSKLCHRLWTTLVPTILSYSCDHPTDPDTPCYTIPVPWCSTKRRAYATTPTASTCAFTARASQLKACAVASAYTIASLVSSPATAPRSALAL